MNTDPLMCEHGSNYLGEDNRWHCLMCSVTWPWSMADYWVENPAVASGHGLRCLDSPCRKCRAETVISEHVWNEIDGCDCGNLVGGWAAYPEHVVEMLARCHIFDGLGDGRKVS